MQIDINDTPATVALKMKILELERENHILKMEVAIPPTTSVMTDLDNLAPITLGKPHLELIRVGSFSLEYDPCTGKRHVMGRCEYGSDRRAVEYSYFLEDSCDMTQERAERVLAEMHKRLLIRLGAQHGF